MSASLSSNGDNFIFNLPSDFIPKVLEDRYKIHLNNFRKPYATVIEYINSCIKDINLPGMNAPTVEQKEFYDKGVDEKDFTLSLSFNYIDMEYMPRYGEGTTDGTKIEDYSNQLKKNDNT